VLIMTSQIAQISQYMFLNYNRFHRIRNYTSSTKTIEALASNRAQRGGTFVGGFDVAWWCVGGVTRWCVRTGRLGGNVRQQVSQNRAMCLRKACKNRLEKEKERKDSSLRGRDCTAACMRGFWDGTGLSGNTAAPTGSHSLLSSTNGRVGLAGGTVDIGGKERGVYAGS